jgi:cytochrome b561
MYEIFNTMHIVTANVMLVIIAIHILAALKHALVDKDTVLARMLPGSSMRES